MCNTVSKNWSQKRSQSCLNAPGIVAILNILYKLSCLNAPGVVKVFKVIYNISCLNAPGVVKILKLIYKLSCLNAPGPGPGVVKVLNIVYKFSCLNAPGVVKVFKIIYNFSCLNAPGVVKVLKIIYDFRDFNDSRSVKTAKFLYKIKTFNDSRSVKTLNFYTIFNTKCIFIYKALRDVTLPSKIAIYCIPSLKIAQHWKPTSFKNFDYFQYTKQYSISSLFVPIWMKNSYQFLFLLIDKVSNDININKNLLSSMNAQAG